MTKKWVYRFSEGNKDMRDLLGGKGSGLAEMTRAGLPVPPGFTITTEACNTYFEIGEKLPDGLWEQVLEALEGVEEETGKKFGDPGNPLLISVRSGAKFSMPGMTESVRVTTNASYFDDHPDSLELWSAGNPAFPTLEATVSAEEVVEVGGRISSILQTKMD